MNKRIIIGARGSALSLAYVEKVKKLLKKTQVFSEKDIIFKKIKTSGDFFSGSKISEIGGKNNFCKEIEEHLESGQIDLAIHALKDMETITNKNLIVAAYLKRNDPEDVLILKKDFKLSKDSTFKIGTCSPRREHQIKNIYTNVVTKEIRGNVDSRIKKITSGEYDGVLLAAAGVKTLKFDNLINKIFSINEIIPSAGQGIIAVQCRKKDNELIKKISKVNDNETEVCARAEKKFLETIGGNCHTAVGVYAEIKKDKLRIISQLFSDDGKKYFYVEKNGMKSNPEELGKLAGEESLLKSKNFYTKKK